MHVIFYAPGHVHLQKMAPLPFLEASTELCALK